MRRRGIQAVARLLGKVAEHAKINDAILPTSVRAGATLLGLGILGDVAYHLVHGITPHAHTTGAFDVAMVIHLTVAAGMALCLVGVAGAGIRSTRSARPRRDHR